MNCADARRQLEAFLDGRLGPDADDAVHRHVESCRACRAATGALGELEQQVGQALSEEQPPDALWHRIEASLAGEAPGRRWWPGDLRAWRAYGAAAAIALAVLGAALYGLGVYPTDGLQARVVAQSVEELATFIESHRPMDVVGRDPATIRDWFVDKVDFTPPYPVVPDGLGLAGGRLCFFLERRIAAYMYQSEGHVIALYVMMGADLQTPPGTPLEIQGEDGRLRELNGFSSAFWRSHDLAYALISDLPANRLAEVARRLSATGQS